MVSILFEISEKSRFCSKFAKNLNSCENFRKISILVKIFDKLDFVRKFLKFRFSSKFTKKNFDFGRNLRKISFSAKICENFLN